MYDTVVQILRSVHGWPENCNPHPDPVAVALQTQTPDAVASALDGYLLNASAQFEPPYGYPGSSYEYLRYQMFRGGEYWSYYTSMALGQIVEPPEDKVREAQSVSEWWEAQENNRTRNGYVMLSLDTDEGRAERARRWARAQQIPLEWDQAGVGLIWQLAVREGYIPTTLDGFAAAYAQTTPRLNEIGGLTAQKWLENLRADDHRRPRPWSAK